MVRRVSGKVHNLHGQVPEHEDLVVFEEDVEGRGEVLGREAV